MKNIFSLICCLVLSTAFLSAQPIGTSSYETMLELGEVAMASNDYYRALEQYELAYEEREDDELVPILAELNYQLRDYRQAERWYKRLLRRDTENEFIEQRYKYGRTLKMQGKYDEAMQEFQQYLDAGSDAEKKRLAQMELAGAELGMSLPGNAQGVAVEALDRKKINTPVSQYTPALSPSGRTLYYASWVGKGVDKEIIESDDEDDPEKFARIFQSQITVEKDREGEEVIEYGDPEPLGVEINRPGYHSANVSLSPDGRRMFFNRIKLTGNVASEAKIYLSEGGDGAWKSANEVVGINGDYRALQPVVGELYGKEVLFFVSDMDGGEGGMDIYYATHQGEGVYGDPVNLGPGINTPADEMTPYWFDGTLYFSSDGYPSLGGLDVFYAVWNGTEWSEPNNMGKAYNTEADELSFRLYDEGYKGFFTSNRPEGRSVRGKTCCDDIYGFAIARQFVDLVVGVFNEIDEAQKMPKREPLKGATVQLIDNGLAAGAEGTQSLTMNSGNRFDYGLNFERSYTVIASHPDFFPDTTTFTTMGVVDSKTFEERFFLKPRPREPEYETVVTNQPIVMENILYDFDDDRITPSAEIDLTLIYEIMTQYPDMKVELGSHTDSRGEDNYNKDLSQRRADSARRWLMRKGIDRTRIVPQGYGETVPQTVTAKVAGQFPYLKEGDLLTEEYIFALPNEDQQEEAFQLNRRTEFKILEGPTSIEIKTTRLKKQDENDRGNNIGAQVEQNDPIKISQMSTLYGQTNLKNVPVMQFTERTKKIGVVKKGEKRTFSYTFTNRGDTDLIIDLISACDCTATNQDDLVGKRFKPGMSGTIEVVFDSADKDEDETIDIDIYLRNNDNQGNPIVEMLNYSFGLKL